MPRAHFNKRDFELLFETHFEDLMAFVYGYVRNQEISRDIVHDAFMALWRRREVLDTRLSPKAYLYKLSRNMSLNYLRHQRVILTNEQSIITHEKDMRQEMDDYDRSYELLAKFVNKLPEKQRAVLKMCFVEGKMYKEIAVDLGISVNTVKTHLKRAIQSLRSELQ
jgi:RNA polymerase sigma-70 factor (ECF subfamily)